MSGNPAQAALALAATLLIPTGYSQTVTVEWLEKERADPRLVILDARPEAEYRQGHIPGALLANTYDHLIDSSPAGERAFHEWLAETLGRLGLDSKHRVIVYENKMGMRAARAFWMLWYAGQPKVGLLEGGFEAWKQKNLPVSIEAPAPRTPVRYRLRPQKKWVATARDVARLTKDRKTVILDVRTRGEYEGTSGSSDCARQGRVPGAVWVEWTEFMDAGREALQSGDKIGALLTERGITPDKQVITYCHRGARAALVWAALDNLGFPKVKNYAGSWHDWAARTELPVE